MDDEVTDLTSLVHRTIRVTNEGRGVSDGLLRSSAIVTDMQDAGRAYNKVVANHPEKEKGSPHTWFFMATPKAIEETLAHKARELISQDLGKAEAVETLRKTVEGQRPYELNARVKSESRQVRRAHTCRCGKYWQYRPETHPTRRG